MCFWKSEQTYVAVCCGQLANRYRESRALYLSLSLFLWVALSRNLHANATLQDIQFSQFVSGNLVQRARK